MSLINSIPIDHFPVIPDPPNYIVGIGSSAGGLEALEELFRAMPTDLNIAFVVVQHLSAESKSLMPDLFERFTSMKVIVLNQDTVCEKNTVYLVPAKT